MIGNVENSISGCQAVNSTGFGTTTNLLNICTVAYRLSASFDSSTYNITRTFSQGYRQTVHRVVLGYCCQLTTFAKTLFCVFA